MDMRTTFEWLVGRVRSFLGVWSFFGVSFFLGVWFFLEVWLLLGGSLRLVPLSSVDAKAIPGQVMIPQMAAIGWGITD